MNKNKYSNLIQLNAENLGIKTVDNEIIDFLNMEIEEKLKTILTQAKKFMRVSKRKTLKVDDLNQSLKFFNFKGLFGYDSYANAEYESIDSLTGLWRPKQNIIDLEDYISKPIASCPMQFFPHFHWVSIEGKRPLIPENFIRDEIKSTTHIGNNKGEFKEANSNQNNLINPILALGSDSHLNQGSYSKNNISNDFNKKTNKIYTPVIHNISKELQIFLENFEQRFRKEIKISKLNPYPLFSMTKELEISLNVIENEPGIVEIIPYIIEFLMKNLTNKQYLDQPKVHMISLSYTHAILKNPYLYIEPYLHQIVTLILSIILIEVNTVQIDLNIKVKDYAIQILKIIFVRYEVKYPNFIGQLLNIFKQNIVPKKNNSNFLTSYGAIKSLNILGPSHVIELVIPRIDEILSILNINYVSIQNKNDKYLDDSNIADDFIKINEDKNKKIDSNTMEIDNDIIQSGMQGRLTFTNTIGNNLFQTPMFSEAIPSQQNFQNSMNTNKIDENIKTDEKSLTELNKNIKKKYSEKKTSKSFYVYYALKESSILAMNYASLTEMKNADILFAKLIDIFGEDLHQHLFSSDNLHNDHVLNLIL